LRERCCGAAKAGWERSCGSNPQTCFQVRARTPKNSVRAGIFRSKPIAFDMPDWTIQAILSAEAWTGLAGTLS
jgi:hypothetical protein